MRSEHRSSWGHDAAEIERLQLQAAVIGSVMRLYSQRGLQ
jgi:hypothetical protein